MVVTTFGLERTTSKKGVPFGRLTLAAGAPVPPAYRDRLQALATALGFTLAPPLELGELAELDELPPVPVETQQSVDADIAY
jgi:hypothetical protein